MTDTEQDTIKVLEQWRHDLLREIADLRADLLWCFGASQRFAELADLAALSTAMTADQKLDRIRRWRLHRIGNAQEDGICQYE